MVAIEGLDRLLREHPFFAGFDAEALDLLAGCAANERFEPGRYLAREGDPADKFYFIRHGTVAIEIRVPGRDPLIVDTLHAGEILGWSWIVPPYRWTDDARAVELVRAVSMDAACLRGKCDRDHTLGHEFFRRVAPVIAERLSSTRLRLVDMYAPRPGTRR